MDSLTGQYDSSLQDVTNMVNNAGVLFDTKIVRAPTVNANAHQRQIDLGNIPVGTPIDNSVNGGLMVNLKGKKWRVTSLAKTDKDVVGDNAGDVVVTLMLQTPEFGPDGKGVQWNTHDDQPSSHAEPSDMYGTSNIRKALVGEDYNGKGGWLSDFIGDDTNFATDYLIQPKKIAYQHNQISAYARQGAGGYATFANEALDVTYRLRPGYYGKSGYDAWGNDYVWIPSCTEIGDVMWDTLHSSVWGLSNPQQVAWNKNENNEREYAWFRSATYSGGAIYSLDDQGSQEVPMKGYPTLFNGIRPAMHLNLTAAAAGLPLLNPEDVETIFTYDITPLSTLDVFDVKDKLWLKVMRDYSDYIEISYYNANNLNTALGGVSDAGVYWVKAEVRAGSTIDGLPMRFGGGIGTGESPDTGPPESDTLRWFKWVVKPKELTVTKPIFDEQTREMTPPTFSDPTEIVDSHPPTLAVRYYGRSNSGIEYDTINEMPAKSGTYTAQAIFVNSAADPTPYVGNYIIRDAEAVICTVTIGKERIIVPSVKQSSQKYVGADLTFDLVNFNDEISEILNVTKPAGVRLEGSDNDGWKLIVKDAGSYRVTFGIDKPIDYCWYINDIETTVPQYIEFTVERKELVVKFTSSTGKFNFQAKDNVQLTADVTAQVNDQVVLHLEYYNKADISNKIPISGHVFDSNIHKPSPGGYTIQATLRDEDAPLVNKNYIISGGIVSKDFTVTKSAATAPTSVSWLWEENDGGLKNITPNTGDTAKNPFIITYTGGKFDFEISTAGFGDKYIRLGSYDNNMGHVNAINGVEIKVRVVPEDECAFLDEQGNEIEPQYRDFTLYLKIDKAKFNLSDTVWGADELTFNGNSQKIELANLNTKLSVSYLNNAKTDADSYTASVLRFNFADINDANNYVLPNKNDPNSYIDEANVFAWEKQWKILPKVVELIWTEEWYEDGEFYLPFIAGKPSYVEYLFRNDAGETVQLGDIVADPSSVTQYSVEVSIKANSANNYVLGTLGDNPYIFFVGKDKTVVTVDLSVNAFTFDTLPKEVTIDNQNGLSPQDFVVTYFRDDDRQNPLSGAPINAGEYSVKVELHEDKISDYTIAGDGWYTFVINPAVLSLDGVRWGYDAADPFVYEWLDGAAVEHVVTLEGLSGKLADVAVYSDNVSSTVDTKIAMVEFVLVGDDVNNYVIEWGSLANQLEWNVVIRRVAQPLVSHSIVYDNQQHVLAELSALEDGWENYFDVKITKNDEVFDNAIAIDAGIYKVTFAIKTVHGSNVIWESESGADRIPKSSTITIEQREVTIEQWFDGKPPMPDIDSKHLAFYQIIYLNEADNIISEEDIMSGNVEYGKPYRVKVVIADGMNVDNVEIVTVEGVEVFAEFIIFDSAQTPHSITLPSDTNITLEYESNRVRFTWEEFGGLADDAKYVMISLPIDGFGVGTHSVTARIRSTVNAVWSDGTKEEINITVEIIKIKINVDWNDAVPPTLNAIWDDYVSYEYFDSSNTPIPPSEFVKNMNYVAHAIIKDEFKETYGFWDGSDYIAEPLRYEFILSIKLAKPTLQYNGGTELTIEFDGAEHTFELVGFYAQYMSQSGDSLSQTKIGNYSVTISLKPGAKWDDGTNSSVTLNFEIKSQINGGGIGNGDGDGGGIANNLPLWQIIATAAGLLLGLIFFGISISNGAKTRKLRSETSEKTTQFNTFAALPLLSAALSGGEKFIGMSSTVWTILACVALAFGVCGLGTMLITGRQKNAAAQKLEKAERAEREEKQARIAREERLEREESARVERRQREEERQQRDNEMKMMFMMMSKRGGGAATEDGPIVYRNAPPTQDVKEIVTQVVAALMPGMQAQLPPTSANTNNDTLEILVKQQMQVLDRQTKIIENFEKKMGREKSDDDEEGG